MATVTINEVEKTFAGNSEREHFTVFSDVSLEVKSGEFVSLLGPSGCGKSTLLNIAAGLDKASSGNVSINDKTINKPGSDRGVVFQEPSLMPWLNVRDNVAFALKKKMGKKEAASQAEKYLKLVHLSKFLHAYPHELSGGMKQRVAIARALSMDPEVLLMDEPFGALDEQTRMMLHKELQLIWQETGKTIIFVTHNIRESILLSDRIVLMGTRPGGIREIFNVDLPRPRNTASPEFINIEKKIMDLLAKEIEKVMKEELGHEYSTEANSLFYRTDSNVGSHI